MKQLSEIIIYLHYSYISFSMPVVYRPHQLHGSTCLLNLTRLRMLDLDAGKGRQVMKSIQLLNSVECFNAGYTTLQWLKSARGMCSREL